MHSGLLESSGRWSLIARSFLLSPRSHTFTSVCQDMVCKQVLKNELVPCSLLRAASVLSPSIHSSPCVSSENVSLACFQCTCLLTPPSASGTVAEYLILQGDSTSFPLASKEEQVGKKLLYDVSLHFNPAHDVHVHSCHAEAADLDCSICLTRPSQTRFFNAPRHGMPGISRKTRALQDQHQQVRTR